MYNYIRCETALPYFLTGRVHLRELQKVKKTSVLKQVYIEGTLISTIGHV